MQLPIGYSFQFIKIKFHNQQNTILQNIMNQLRHQGNTLVEKGPFYQIRKVINEINNKPNHYKWIINQKELQKYKLQTHIQYNIKVFTCCKELVPGYNLHHILQQKITTDGNLNIYMKPYQCRLDYIEKVNQQQSIKILKQVVEAIYCLCKQNYQSYNIRAENFVKAQIQNQTGNLGQSKNYRWKLRSVPYGYTYPPSNPQIDSPYTWKKQYQPPEAYNRQLTKKQLNQSLVWSIGCIWMQILYGQNLLNSEQNIKKFCLGNGKYGRHNVQIFQLQKKLSKQNQYLLSQMLSYDPEKRMSLKSIFQHKDLGLVICCLKKDSDISKNLSTQSEPLISYKQRFIFKQYATITQFILDLIKIINQKNIPPMIQENSAIKKFQKKSKKTKQQLQYKPKQLKKSKQPTLSQVVQIGENIRELTSQNLEKYIKPFKFYYDKCIFLSNCSLIITKKLKQLLKKSQRMQSASTIPQERHDAILIFQFAIIQMRLVYLQTLVQNLRLHQNIFTIPDTTFNIENTNDINLSNSKPQWQIFSQTALYESLKLFIQIKLVQCKNQLEQLLQNQSSIKYNRLSNGCRDKIRRVFKEYDYKVCRVDKYLPYYQRVMIETLSVVDQFNITKKQFKIPMNDVNDQWEQNMRYIGYLWTAIFIQSQNLFSEKYYQQMFARYMKNQPIQAGSFLKLDHINILKSRIIMGNLESFYSAQKSEEVFDFKNYENFLQLAPAAKVTDQVQNLMKKFVL